MGMKTSLLISKAVYKQMMTEQSRKEFLRLVENMRGAMGDEAQKTGCDYSRGYKDALSWVTDLLDALDPAWRPELCSEFRNGGSACEDKAN